MIIKSELIPQQCKGCGNRVFYCLDHRGKTQILDAVAPVWEQAPDHGGASRVIRIEAYVSHFSTCPKANDFSKKKQEA